MEPPRLLIFDFDGVLGNTEDLYFVALAAVLQRDGVELTKLEYYNRCLGLPDEAAFAAVLGARGRHVSPTEMEELVALRRREYAALLHRAHLFPGVSEILRALHPHHLLAIASGAFRDEIDAVIDRDGVRDLFAAIVAAEDVSRGKPAPDPFLRALETVNRDRRLGLEARHCLVVEDAPTGIAAAHAAGMRCIAVSTSHEREALAAADLVIDDLSQLSPSEDWPA